MDDRWLVIGIGASLLGMPPAAATTATMAAPEPIVVAQAMVPPTGMGDADRPMAAEERMRRRFPQPVRVGDLIGLPILDDGDRILGYVRAVARTPQDKIELIVDYSRWCGWCGFATRPVAVPVELVGILGRALASLDMPAQDYAAAPTWQAAGATLLANDDTIRIALARR